MMTGDNGFIPMPRELDLINAIARIASLSNVSAHFTAGLAIRIESTERRIDDLTIGEFLAIADEYTKQFNRY